MANNTRIIALEAICSVVLEKKSLSAFNYPEDSNTFLIKSLVFGTIRFYHQLNDIVSKQLKHSLKKEDLDIHCLMLLGAYQLFYSNIVTHASIFETVNIVNTLNKPWSKALVLYKATAVFNLAKFEQGACYIQDASVQLAATIKPKKY